MTQTGFIAAMAAELVLEIPSSPAVPDARTSEWIIVSIWGGNREFLTLSRTGRPVQQHDAPSGLHPVYTVLGILLSRSTGDAGEVSEYMLMRNQPADMPVAGVFHATDGFVRLTLRDDVPSVTANGRPVETQHSADRAPGLPDPAADTAAWRLTAVRRPWIGEFAAVEPQSDRLAVTSPAPALKRTRRPVQPLVVPPRNGDSANQGPRHRSAEPSPSAPAVPGAPPSAPSATDHLAPADPTPHNRRRKRPEANHDVKSEA